MSDRAARLEAEVELVCGLDAAASGSVDWTTPRVTVVVRVLCPLDCDAGPIAL
jgi:hypothetical protein